MALDLLSPAKVNLFLHITGRRPDRYHTIQTLFQLLDYGDQMRFDIREDGQCRLTTEIVGVNRSENLITRAAIALKTYARCKLGADIAIQKRLPIGGGLGGGSSNAATTLVALNHLWRTGLTRSVLCDIGLELGADVPVFVKGRSAWGEDIGERLRAVELPRRWYLIIKPKCNISTASVFCQKELTRDSLPITLSAFFEGGSRNDCETVVATNYPEVAEALDWLNQYAPARLTGTGACVFAAFPTKIKAQSVLEKTQVVNSDWLCFVARGCNKSPLLTLPN
jgi:4-diphosphocytidyl-2-C-methyl-D-erythritol kinase